MPAQCPDILLIGAGVIGLTTALKLAQEGCAVTVLEKSESGREASWAGAGILPPGNVTVADTAEARLRALSHGQWPRLSAELLELTGFDNGYHVCGELQVETIPGGGDPPLEQRAQGWLAEGLRIQWLNREESVRHVPGLNPDFQNCVFVPDCAQVRNPAHLKALKAACLLKGVEIREHAADAILVRDGSRATKIQVHDRELQCDRVCITSGAWSSSVLRQLGVLVPIRPVRGQIVQLRLPAQPFACILEQGRRYLVPRRDGLVLVGSTEEEVGFVKQNTTAGVSGLLDFALKLVPALRQAELVRTWAGLRPASPDGLPLIGPVPGMSNVFVGAGHFRAGLQMSPGTAQVLADLLMNRTPSVSLAGLETDRFLSL